MTDKPTPKEMENLFVEETGFDPDDFPAAIFGFARAVLEKWGQPAQATEPVAVVVPCYTPSGKRVALYSAKQDLPIGTKLYAAPQPSPTAQAADSVPAPVQSGLVATMLDALRHAQKVLNHNNLHMECGPVNAAILAACAPADSVTAPAGGVDDAVDAIALARYKVVPAHESMFHRFAVVAGDGKQQLYLGREVECENMARKFAGAFLDGAFYQSNIAPTPPAQAAGSVLEDAERHFFDAGWKACANFCDRDDVVADGIIGFGACPQFEAAFRAARKQGATHDR